MSKGKPTVGQTLYSLNVGNAARNNEQKLTPVTVTTVGRKYFSVQEGDNEYTKTQFLLSSWREHSIYAPTVELYETPQEWEDKKEESTISKMIGAKFQYGRNNAWLSLQKLRAIEKIIEDRE